MEAREDFELIERVRSGDREAYAGIVRRHQGKLLQLCLSLLGDPSSAEEAAQEAFLKAYRSLGGFQGYSSFATWLYRIAYNLCQDLLRQKIRRRAESWDELLEREGEGLHRLLAAGPDPAAAAEAADLIQRILARLPEEQSSALLLREIQGLSYQEIASVLGCSLDSVKARLRRARRTLGEGLRHFLGPENV